MPLTMYCKGTLAVEAFLGVTSFNVKKYLRFPEGKFAGPAADKRGVRSSFLHRVFASPVMKGAEAIGESWARAVVTREDDGFVLIKIQSL